MIGSQYMYKRSILDSTSLFMLVICNHHDLMQLTDCLNICSLLNQARVKIMRESGKNSWEELRDDFQFQALKEYILQGHGLPYNTASLLCESTNINRKDEYVLVESPLEVQ